MPLIQAALKEAGLTASDIDAVAYTAGPGLVGALLVGATVGRSLAFAWNVPAIPVHHMEGHLLAPMLEDNPRNSRLWRYWSPADIRSSLA